MNKTTEVYTKLSHTKNELMISAKNTFAETFPFIILGLNVIFAIVSKLFDTWITNPFTPSFFINLVSNILLTMLSYVCFVQYGEKIEKISTESYSKNCKAWSLISERVRINHAEEFFTFCREQADVEREERRRAIILNKTLISYDTYLTDYKGASKSEIRKAKKQGIITARDAFYINRANSSIKIKPISPLLIFCGIKLSHPNDAGRRKISASTVSIVSRPAFMFLTTAVVMMFKGSYIGFENASVVFDMMYSVMLIILSSFFGFSAGTKSAKQELERIEARIFFLERFEKSIDKNTGGVV